MAVPALLPDPLGQVAIAPAISPSMLAAGPVCTLKRQARERDGSRIAGLVESPWAIVGTLVHRAIELADGRSNLTEVFEELVSRREFELLADARRRHLVPLRSAIGEVEWSSRLKVLASRRGDRPALAAAQLEAPANVSGESHGTNHEVWFQSDALGLRGSIDHIESLKGRPIRITDWKTGALFGADGEVKEHFRLQLAAYRMLAQERWPEREIETYLFNGDSLRVYITSEDEQQVLEAVAKIQSVIGGRQEAMAEDLALLGNECSGCAIRHRCPAYLEVLLTTGRGESAGDPGTFGDVLGRVLEAKEQGDVFIINLRLPTGSQVQVRLSNRLLDCAELQDHQLAFFGLVPFPRRSRVTGETLEPLLYQEVAQSRRTWQTEVFRL